MLILIFQANLQDPEYDILETLQISIPASVEQFRIFASRTPIYITAVRETQEIEP